jgi:hypothetical protein
MSTSSDFSSNLKFESKTQYNNMIDILPGKLLRNVIANRFREWPIPWHFKGAREGCVIYREIDNGWAHTSPTRHMARCVLSLL